MGGSRTEIRGGSIDNGSIQRSGEDPEIRGGSIGHGRIQNRDQGRIQRSPGGSIDKGASKDQGSIQRLGEDPGIRGDIHILGRGSRDHTRNKERFRYQGRIQGTNGGMRV